MSYIDHLNKTIFNGSDLGKIYSAAAIINALQYKPTGNTSATTEQVLEKTGVSLQGNKQTKSSHTAQTLLDELFNPYDSNASLPNPFGPKKKKKKRRKVNL